MWLLIVTSCSLNHFCFVFLLFAALLPFLNFLTCIQLQHLFFFNSKVTGLHFFHLWETTTIHYHSSFLKASQNIYANCKISLSLEIINNPVVLRLMLMFCHPQGRPGKDGFPGYEVWERTLYAWETFGLQYVS